MLVRYACPSNESLFTLISTPILSTVLLHVLGSCASATPSCLKRKWVHSLVLMKRTALSPGLMKPPPRVPVSRAASGSRRRPSALPSWWILPPMQSCPSKKSSGR